MLFDDETLDWLITKLTPNAIFVLGELNGEWSQTYTRISVPPITGVRRQFPGLVERNFVVIRTLRFSKSRNRSKYFNWECGIYRLTELGLALKAKLEGD